MRRSQFGIIRERYVFLVVIRWFGMRVTRRRNNRCAAAGDAQYGMHKKGGRDSASPASSASFHFK